MNWAKCPAHFTQLLVNAASSKTWINSCLACKNNNKKKSRKEGARDLPGQVVTLLVAFLKARGGGWRGWEEDPCCLCSTLQLEVLPTMLSLLGRKKGVGQDTAGTGGLAFLLPT